MGDLVDRRQHDGDIIIIDIGPPSEQQDRVIFGLIASEGDCRKVVHRRSPPDALVVADNAEHSRGAAGNRLRDHHPLAYAPVYPSHSEPGLERQEQLVATGERRGETVAEIDVVWWRMIDDRAGQIIDHVRYLRGAERPGHGAVRLESDRFAAAD